MQIRIFRRYTEILNTSREVGSLNKKSIIPIEMSNYTFGGPYQGYVAKPTMGKTNDSEITAMRSVLKRGWNTGFANNTYNNKSRVVTPFRAVNSLGDYLQRQNYVCGGPNPNGSISKTAGLSRHLGNARSACDGTGVPATSCNPKFVSDSSDYIRFKKQRAYNVNYNNVKA